MSIEIKQHGDQKYVYADMSNLSERDAIKEIKSQVVFFRELESPIPMLLNIDGLELNNAVFAEIKKKAHFVKKNTTKGAMIGAEKSFKLILLKTFNMLTGMGMRPCKTKEEALAFLLG